MTPQPGQVDLTSRWSKEQSTSTTRRVGQRSPGGRSYVPFHEEYYDEEPRRPTTGRRGGRINGHGIEGERWLYNGRRPSRGSGPWADNSKEYVEPLDYDGHQGNRSPDRRPTHLNAPFPHFSREDPYKWLNEVEHYFAIHRVPRNERIYMVSLYLHGKAYKWWQQLNILYEKDHKRLGWTTFVEEFRARWRSSTSMNLHEQRRDAPKAMDDLPHEKRVEAHDASLPSSEEMASEEEAKKDLSLITSMKIPTSDANNNKASFEGDSSDQADH